MSVERKVLGYVAVGTSRVWQRWAIRLILLCAAGTFAWLLVWYVHPRYLIDRYRCMNFSRQPSTIPTRGWPACAVAISLSGWETGSEEFFYFMHLRKDTSGVERLIVVRGWQERVQPQSPGQYPEGKFPYRLVVDAEIYEPGLRKAAYCYRYSTADIWLGFGTQCTVLTGYCDPADESHFSIPYSVDSAPGVVDGWFDDQKGLKFEVRQGTAAAATIPP